MAKLNMFILLLMLTTITLMTTGCEKPISDKIQYLALEHDGKR